MAWSKTPGVPLIVAAFALLLTFACEGPISKFFLALFGRMAYALPFFLAMAGIAQYLRVHYTRRVRLILRGLGTVPILSGLASGIGILAFQGPAVGGLLGKTYYQLIAKMLGDSLCVLVGLPPLILLALLLWEPPMWQLLGRQKSKTNDLTRMIGRSVLVAMKWAGGFLPLRAGRKRVSSVCLDAISARGDFARRSNADRHWANRKSIPTTNPLVASLARDDEAAYLPLPDPKEGPVPVILPEPAPECPELAALSEKLDDMAQSIQDTVQRLAGVKLVPCDGSPRIEMRNILFEFRKGLGQLSSVRHIQKIAADIGCETGRAPVNIDLGTRIRFELPLREAERRFAPIRPLLLEASVKSNEPIKYLLGRRHDGSVFELAPEECLHCLIGGETGSGKSVLLHNLIFGLVFRYDTSKVRLALYDHKLLEFANYQSLPHLWQKVVTTESGFYRLLNNLQRELVRRKHARSQNPAAEFPALVTILDEFHGLSDQRLIEVISEARALDMFFVLATQHPTAQVVSTQIKANLVTRIALKVSSINSSQLIIGRSDATRLLAKGDCLVLGPSGLARVQSGFCSRQDLATLKHHLSVAINN